MSAPVTRQLRDYFALVDEQQGAVDLDVLGDGSERLVTSVRLPVAAPWRRVGVAAVVATLVVVVVGMTIMFSAGEQPDVATTIPGGSTTSVPASTTTLPDTTTTAPPGTTTTVPRATTTSTPPPFSSPPVNPVITQVIDGNSGALVADGDSVLVVSSRRGISGKLEVTRLDASTGDVVDINPDYGYSGNINSEVLRNEDQLWISFTEDDGGPTALLRFDLNEGEVADRVPTSSMVTAVARAGDALWAFQSSGQLLRIDPETAEVTDRINPPPSQFTLWAGAVDNTIWAYDISAGLFSFDPSTGEFSTSTAPRELDPSEFEFWLGYVDRDVVWLVSAQGQVERFDTTQGVTTLEFTLGSDVGYGATWEGGIWLPSREGVLYRIDLVSGETKVYPLEIGTNPGRPVVAGGSLWIPQYDDNTILRIDSPGP